MDATLIQVIASQNAKIKSQRTVRVRQTFTLVVTNPDGEVKEYHKLGARKIKEEAEYYKANGHKVNVIETTPLISPKLELPRFVNDKVVHEHSTTILPPTEIEPEVKTETQATFPWEVLSNTPPAFLSDYVRPKMADVAKRNKVDQIRRDRESRSSLTENKFKVRDRVSGNLIFSGNDEDALVRFMMERKVKLSEVVLKVPEYIKRKLMLADVLNEHNLRFE